MDAAKEWVRMHVKLFEQQHDPDSPATKFWRMVYETGMEFRPGSLAATLGQSGWCFKNAFDLTVQSTHLAYAEGWALSTHGLPVQHAWCVTETGEVVETTWPEVGLSYFGIPFEKKSLVRYTLKTKVYGVFNDLMRHRTLPLVHPWFQPPTPISS